MNPHNDLAADLPPPNADEPATLRQDIVDELADHLTCAARQEALRAELDTDGDTPDEQTIADRVLARFGDPRRIARRLWFDAMKGRLMMQKLTAAFAAIAAAAAIAACVLLWTALEATRSTLDATQSTLAQSIEENRKERVASEQANRAMLAQLAKVEAAAQKPASPEWNPLRFKLLLGERGTKPAREYSVSLQGHAYTDKSQAVLKKKSDGNGLVEFGLVRPGGYMVTVTSPWDYYRFSTIQVAAGSKNEMTIRCPALSPGRTKLKVQLALPADLGKRKLAAFVLIRRPELKVGDAFWTFPQPDPALLISKQFGTQRVSYVGSGVPGVHKIDYFDKPHVQTGTLGILDTGYGGIQSIDLVNAWTLPYKVETLAIVLPAYPELPGVGGVAGAGGVLGGPMGMFGVGPMGSGPHGPMGGQPTTNFVMAYISYGERRPLGLFSDNPPTFTPQAGKENVWKITLPPKLIEQAREAMKKVDGLKKKPDGKKS